MCVCIIAATVLLSTCACVHRENTRFRHFLRGFVIELLLVLAGGLARESYNCATVSILYACVWSLENLQRYFSRTRKSLSARALVF